jgi:UDP-N-acetylglucosamine 2-epimerase (non-hydrolysing)
MKVAPLHRAFQPYADSIRHLIVHTGQHYDQQMSKIFFDELELPHPDVYLGVGSASHAQQTAKVMVEFEKVIDQQKPDLVIVVGDVNSTLACALVCAKMNVQAAHVEAGLRSFDRAMPEEINRLVTDAISDYLFVSEPSGIGNLTREGIEPRKIFHVGNVMIDSLIHFQKKARQSVIADQLGLLRKSYALVTLHRPSNVDEVVRLKEIIELLWEVSKKKSVVFPIHPRTRKMIQQFGLQPLVDSINGLRLTEPFGYLDFLSLMENAAVLITDSGGIQEETTYLGVPCITLRENTERPITVEIGTNILCGSNLLLAKEKCLEAMKGEGKQGSIPELWDGKTADRIVKVVAEHIN